MLIQTTMLIGSHWKVIKRDFLPKFFRPRLDLVVFIIIKRLIPHHQQRQIRILKGREKPSWKKDFKREWRKLEKHEEKENVHVKRQGVYPFLKYEKRDQENGDNSQKNKICVAFSNSNALRDVTNDLVINNGSIQNNEEIKDGELIFAELETYLDEAKKTVIEQHQAKNYHWANSVVKNFSEMKR
ncbi:unnamed protein product [Rhizophagus irregularis]|nr:unnamed protein product [Rhizophagus irregularis]